jgi:hypothetical protein
MYIVQFQNYIEEYDLDSADHCLQRIKILLDSVNSL